MPDVTTIDATGELLPSVDSTKTTDPAITTGPIDGQWNFTGNWKEQFLEPDIRGEKFFDSDYTKNVKTLLKKAYHTEKQLGKYTSGDKGARVPNDKSTPDEIQAFRDAVGVPKEYAYKRPDDIDKDVVTSEFMTDTMKKLNEASVSQKQFDIVMDIFQNRIRAFEVEGIAELNKRTTDAIERIQKEWGDKLDSRTDLTRRFITKMTDHWPAEKYQELFGKENEKGEREGGINVPEFAHIRPLLLDMFATIEESYGIPSSAALSDTVQIKVNTIEDDLKVLEATPGFMEGRLRTSSNPEDRAKHEEILKKRKDLIRRQEELKNKVTR